jgi:hypothetical protein
VSSPNVTTEICSTDKNRPYAEHKKFEAHGFPAYLRNKKGIRMTTTPTHDSCLFGNLTALFYGVQTVYSGRGKQKRSSIILTTSINTRKQLSPMNSLRQIAHYWELQLLS